MQEELLALLGKCASICSYCATACLEEADVKMLTQCIKLDLDCAEICTASASFLSRGSVHAKHLLRECAEICAACAAECGKHAHMQHCERCSQICKQCADACKQAQAA